MPNELIAILTQLPVVAIFIWYSERTNRQFQEYLRQEREAFLVELKLLVVELTKINTTLLEHDMKTDMAVARMERAKPRTASK